MKPHSRILIAFVLGLGLSLSLGAQEQGAEVAAPPVPPANPLKTKDELQAAYQKEYAFLEAQMRDLQARLSAFDADSRRAEADREAQIDRVEGEYIDLQSRGERLNGLITEAERQVASVEDSRSTLEATFLQAGSTLEPFDIAPLRNEDFLSSPDDERISVLLSHTLDLLGNLGRVRQAPGSFFLQTAPRPRAP